MYIIRDDVVVGELYQRLPALASCCCLRTCNIVQGTELLRIFDGAPDDVLYTTTSIPELVKWLCADRSRSTQVNPAR